MDNFCQKQNKICYSITFRGKVQIIPFRIVNFQQMKEDIDLLSRVKSGQIQMYHKVT